MEAKETLQKPEIDWERIKKLQVEPVEYLFKAGDKVTICAPAYRAGENGTVVNAGIFYVSSTPTPGYLVELLSKDKVWIKKDEVKKCVVSSLLTLDFITGDKVVCVLPVHEAGRIGIIKQINYVTQKLYIQWQNISITRAIFQQETYWVGAKDVKKWIDAPANDYIFGDKVVVLRPKNNAGKIGIVNMQTSMELYIKFEGGETGWSKIVDVKRYTENVVKALPSPVSQLEVYNLNDKVVAITDITTPTRTTKIAAGTIGLVKEANKINPSRLYIYWNESESILKNNEFFASWADVKEVKKHIEVPRAVEFDIPTAFCDDECRQSYREDRMEARRNGQELFEDILTFRKMCAKLKLCCYCESALK